jgi:hypothetical protein
MLNVCVSAHKLRSMFSDYLSCLWSAIRDEADDRLIDM